jgi:hypothetical protein
VLPKIFPALATEVQFQGRSVPREVSSKGGQFQRRMAEHPFYGKLANCGADPSSVAASLMLASVPGGARSTQTEAPTLTRKPAFARLFYRAVAAGLHFGLNTLFAIWCASARRRRLLSGQQVEEVET